MVRLAFRCNSWKKLNQWFFKISSFAEELLSDLDTLNQWPEKVKIMQKIGLENLLNSKYYFELKGLKMLNQSNVTQQDQTHFLVLFLALSVDHPLSKFMKRQNF